jgi:uncharacterized membrane protein YphA (DoxX/SURF4 family)
MELFTLISAIIIALVFILAGFLKLAKTQQIIASRQDYSIKTYRYIAWGEIIGALLFVLPYQFNFLPFLSTVAAFGLTVLMIGAPISHIKMGEHREAALTTTLLILILVVTFIRIFE